MDLEEYEMKVCGVDVELADVGNRGVGCSLDLGDIVQASFKPFLLHRSSEVTSFLRRLLSLEEEPDPGPGSVLFTVFVGFKDVFSRIFFSFWVDFAP